MHHAGGVQVLDGQQKIVNQSLGLQLVYLVLPVAQQLLKIEVEEFHDQVELSQFAAIFLCFLVGKSVEQAYGKLVVFLSTQFEQDLQLSSQHHQLQLFGAFVSLQLDGLKCHHSVGWNMKGLVDLAIRSSANHLQNLVLSNLCSHVSDF